MLRDVTNTITSRSSRLCNFIEWTDDLKLIFRRYASLYFIFCVDKDDNELLTLEIIHHFVEALDAFFGNVCELDLIVSLHFPPLFTFFAVSISLFFTALCVSLFHLVCSVQLPGSILHPRRADPCGRGPGVLKADHPASHRAGGDPCVRAPGAQHALRPVPHDALHVLSSARPTRTPSLSSLLFFLSPWAQSSFLSPFSFSPFASSNVLRVVTASAHPGPALAPTRARLRCLGAPGWPRPPGPGPRACPVRSARPRTRTARRGGRVA